MTLALDRAVGPGGLLSVWKDIDKGYLFPRILLDPQLTVEGHITLNVPSFVRTGL